jgi:formylglycine-generating enzyme
MTRAGRLFALAAGAMPMACATIAGLRDVPDPSTAPSCASAGAGMTSCGASSESCCTSPTVSGGSYERTYSAGNDGGTDPASVSAFRLDAYEVTVGRFRQFVSAWNGGYTPPAGSGKHVHLNGGSGLVNSGGGGFEPGWATPDNANVAPTDAHLACDPDATWTSIAGDNETLPMNCVNWWESYAFCIWDGGFLPSEAEWEYAAAGGSEQRDYPWGATAPGSANQYAIYGCYYPTGTLGACADASVAPVGSASMGAGAWGQLDLAGNVWEWNLDWSAPYVGECGDCAYLTATSSSERVVRGGDFYLGAPYLFPAYRGSNPSTYRGNDIGVRCARVP